MLNFINLDPVTLHSAMNRITIFVAFFILASYDGVLGQNQAEKNEDSSARTLDSLRELARDFIALGELDSAKYQLNILLTNANDQDNERYEAICYDMFGTIEERRGEYAKAAEYGERAVAYFRANNDDEWLDDALFGLAERYQFLGKFDLALKLAFENIAVASRTQNKDVLAGTYQVIGNVNSYLGNYDEAANKYDEAILLYEELKDEEGLHYIYFAKALLHGTQGERDVAIELAQKARQLAMKVDNMNEAMAASGYLAHLYTEQEEYAKAADLAEQVLTFFRQQNEMDRLVSALITRATIHQKLKEYPDAIRLVDEAISYAQATQSIYNLTSVYELKIQLHEQAGDYKAAYQTAQDLAMVNDSVFQLEKVSAITEHEIKYETEKKERELLAQKLKLQKSEFNNTILGIGLGAAALFSLLFFYFNRQRQRAKTKLAQQDLEIQKEKVANLEKREKLLAIEYMVVGQEKERQRIAQDLHDGLGGLLSTVKAHVTNIQEQVQALENLNVLVKTNNLVDHACEEVRRISHNMMPSSMRLGGIKQAIEEIVAQMESAHGLQVDAELSGLDTDIPQDDAVIILRIIQELTNNIVKHAQARKVTLQINRFDSELNILVEDDGVGFTADASEGEGGLGLKSVRSRVKFLDGTVDFYSKPNEGLSTSINIPIT